MNDSSLKILICDDTAELGIRIASRLRDADMFAYTRRNERTVILNSILSDKPDVIIAELSLRDSDSVSLMEHVSSVMSRCPEFIIISDIKNSFIERQVIESGASFVLTKPIDPEEVLNAVKLVAVKKPSTDCNDAEIMVTDLIRGLGIPAHIKGYRYIRTAVLECISSRMLLENVTKELYPRVAEIYKTTPSRVERAIRHAIGSAWARHDTEALNSFFGCCVDNFPSRPTNSEFIALAVDRIGLQMKAIENRKKITSTEYRRRYY